MMVLPVRGVLGLCFGVVLVNPGFSSAAAPAAAPISFNNQVQPVLSEYCYPCHGPDSATRKPKKHPLRLDREQFAFEPRDDGKPVIVKGDPNSSEVIRRLKAKDDDVMPPASEHKTVKPSEIAIIEQWITQGAKYEKHWSLIPPSRPAVPEAGGKWAKSPIDHFVARKLGDNGLKPNPEEHAARLFRRLSFDLTGLPPSPAAVKQFEKDSSEKSYEKAVDGMLASDACAEQFARHWLDAVRYADTQGIHHDHSRSIWPYRDWVIHAFKTNMPFDEFTIEQVAGDMLPDATMQQKIASGYNRLLPTTGEGGAIPEEYSAIYAKDRADTTSAVWIGLTAGCATCHDHKFDPITSKDFYSLTAFFRNNTQPALDSGSSGNTAPLLFIPAPQDQSRWPELEKAIAANQKEIDERKEAAKPDFEHWVETAASQPAAAPADPDGAKSELTLPLSETNGPWHGVFHGATVELSGTREQRPGPFGPAPLVGDGPAVEKAEPGMTRTGQASYGAFLYLEEKPNGAVFSRMNKSDNFRGWDLFLTSGRPTVHIIDEWPEKALKITAKKALKPGRWHHVMASFDGSRKGAEALALFVDGKKAEVDVNNDGLGTNITTDVPFRLGARSDKSGAADMLTDGKVYLQDVRFYTRALTPQQVARIAADGLVRDYATTAKEERSSDQTDSLYNLFLAGFDPSSQKLRAEMEKLKTEQAEVRERGATSLVMEEKKEGEPMAFVLNRGNYASKGEKVTAATPEALPKMAADLPRNRLGLARWLVSREHPLTARVTVNRIWAHLLGIGIVETTEDLGVKGARPTNQDLLDWLAVEFMDSGWDYRKMVRDIVLSATYRQSETASPEKLEKDPQNKLCSRGPHLRLEAEEIRDQTLAASGLLVTKIGGPPVKPYQPEGVWESVAMKDSNTRVYTQDHGDALYRRSMYTFWKRVAPPPSLEILNAPSREVFCTRRDRTDTPLQALVTMNDPQFVEASRHLAGEAMRASKDFDGCLNSISERLLARDFTSEERAVARRMYDKSLKTFQSDASAVDALLKVGESAVDEKLSRPELAAWTLVASEIMNLDEALTK
jgi:hypothetical protein